MVGAGMAPGMSQGGMQGMGPGMAPGQQQGGFNPPPMPAPAMAGSSMSQMTQTMAPIRPGVPPQPAPVYPQAPSPMRGFLIDEDPDS
jgi:hypothetical protein